MRQAYIYICLMFTFCGCEWCIYTPVLYLGPYHTKKRSLAALQGKSISYYIMISHTYWCVVVYCTAGNFHGRKPSRIGGKKIIAAITFADCSLVPPKDITPPHFMEKAFANSHKTLKFAKVFSFQSFPLYSIGIWYIVLQYVSDYLLFYTM